MKAHQNQMKPVGVYFSLRKYDMIEKSNDKRRNTSIELNPIGRLHGNAP